MPRRDLHVVKHLAHGRVTLPRNRFGVWCCFWSESIEPVRISLVHSAPYQQGRIERVRVGGSLPLPNNVCPIWDKMMVANRHPITALRRRDLPVVKHLAHGRVTLPRNRFGV